MLKQILAVSTLLLSGMSHAQTIEQIKLLGFSPEGNYLAFEILGIEDGSGFPFSKITFVDTKKNKWVGTQVFTRVQNEETPLHQVSTSNLAKAKPQLKKFLIDGNRGKTFSVSKSFEDDQKISYQYYNLDNSTNIVLETQEFEIPSEKCASMDYVNHGFSLSYTPQDTQLTRYLQKDLTLPKSRHCTANYQIEFGWQFKQATAYVVSYNKAGFEGADKRYLVVTTKP